MLHLDNNIYFTWSVFRGVTTCHIRQYREYDTGSIYPTRTGFSFGVRAYYELQEIIHEMDLIKDAAALEATVRVPAPLAGLSQTCIVPKLASHIKGLILERRQAENHDADQKAKPTDMELRQALDLARKKKYLPATVFETGELTMSQFVTLDFDVYWTAYEAELGDSVRKTFE